jgi:hypothetical protein
LVTPEAAFTSAGYTPFVWSQADKVLATAKNSHITISMGETI